jgi:ABC-type sugar transport system ATPase subunit
MPAPTAVARPPRGANGAPVIECVEVSKTYGGVRALRGVSLALRPGEITALVGDNGAGKSTLVGVLGGMVTPDGGRLIVDGAAYGHLTPRHAATLGIEVVYQDLALCDNLRAADNIVLGREPVSRTVLGVRFLDRRRAREIGRDRVSVLGAGIADWDVPARRLSGGQRQALAISRATISAHRLLVLDEPTAALGVRQTEATLALLRNVVAEGMAILLIMHNLDQIFAVSDRIVVLRLGSVVLDARTADTGKEEVVARMTGIAGAMNGGPGR